MKTFISLVVPALALFAAATASGAEKDEALVTRVYNDVVTPASQQAYEAAVKNYNKCLAKHGFKFEWTAWAHETGNTYSYSYAAGPYKWADFDTMHTTGKPCDKVWQTAANPHLSSESSAFFVEVPDMSRKPDVEPAKNLITVTYFMLKPTHEADEAFTTAAKKVTEAANKAKWPGYYVTYRVKAADTGAPDYILVAPKKDWADYGAMIDPPFWKMVENTYGKQEADSLRKTINDALKDSSTHIDRYSAELTYKPTSK